MFKSCLVAVDFEFSVVLILYNSSHQVLRGYILLGTTLTLTIVELKQWFVRRGFGIGGLTQCYILLFTDLDELDGNLQVGNIENELEIALEMNDY